MIYQWVCKKSNTTGATSGTGTAYPSGAPEFTPGFYMSIVLVGFMLFMSSYVVMYTTISA